MTNEAASRGRACLGNEDQEPRVTLAFQAIEKGCRVPESSLQAENLRPLNAAACFSMDTRTNHITMLYGPPSPPPSTSSVSYSTSDAWSRCALSITVLRCCGGNMSATLK